MLVNSRFVCRFRSTLLLSLILGVQVQAQQSYKDGVRPEVTEDFRLITHRTIEGESVSEPHSSWHGDCEESRCSEDSWRLEAEFDDGFAFFTADEEYELRIHILNQVDYKAFAPGEQEPAAQDGVYIPRMRVYFEGKLTDPFRYEVSLQRSVEGTFDLLDANLDIRFSDQFQLRFGRTLIPYSYTWYDHLEQYFIVPERPLFPLNFGLSRAAGLQLWGEDPNRAWEYSLGIYDGRLAGIADNSTIYDGVGYFNFRPFAKRPGTILQNLNLGGSIVVGETDVPTEGLPLRTSVQSSENDEAAFAASAVFLEFNPDFLASGDRLLGAIHVANYHGPFSFEAEWNALDIDFLNETTAATGRVQANGFHVTLASFLTGETINGRATIEPNRPFDPRCGCSLGALEAFVRYSYLKFGDELFDEDVADRNEWTDEVSMTDVGLNWYLNRHVKFYLDWQHAAYAQRVLINEDTGAFTKYNDLYWLRCQFYF